MLRTDDLDFDLPADRIATRPAWPRESARLLVTWRDDPSRIEHAAIADLPKFAKPGDLFILNRTRVLAARLVGTRAGTGGHVEGLYLHTHPCPPPERMWAVLLKGKSVRAGIRISLQADSGADAHVTLEPVEKLADEPGAWLARVHGPPASEADAAILDRCGRTPLPPYILKARKAVNDRTPDATDRAWYATSFDTGSATSVAAPTAGFHLTESVRGQLAEAGATFADIELAVGVGTFRPVETEFVEDHPMHREWCSMPPATRSRIAAAKERSGRVICVGTTAARSVESLASTTDESAWTRLLITPGYRWRVTDGLLTNFHLPRSTLLAMVAALFEGGIPVVKHLYAAAIAHDYRFFSYGDAMLILPGRP